MSAVVFRTSSVAVGIWLMFAPAALGYAGAAGDNDRIVGPIAASVALIAMAEVVRGVRLVNVASGAWLVASAFLLSYPAAGAANAVLVGVALIALAVPAGTTKHRYGGGWAALARRRGSSEESSR